MAAILTRLWKRLTATLTTAMAFAGSITTYSDPSLTAMM
jgi:hypothetical protein